MSDQAIFYTSMSKRNKLKAALLGYAVGDALGKGTEFMVAREVKLRYPEPLRSYDQIYQDAHRSQWEPGQWTADTEAILTMIRQLIRDRGEFVELNQAKALKEWYATNPMDVIACMRGVISQPDYLDNPLETSRRVWEQASLDPSNECLGRAFIGALSPGDALRNCRMAALLTHYDIRCEVMSFVIGLIARDLMNIGRITPITEIRRLVNQHYPQMTSFLNSAMVDNLEDLDLSDFDTYWSVRKSTGAALWCLFNGLSAKEALYTMVDAGGDADTNAALALALIGLRDGAMPLPDNLIEELVGRDEIEKAAADLAYVWNL